MEQLANFVTKSFEYNNNRVLDMINKAVKPSMIDDKIECKSISENAVDDCDDESLDVDITDVEISSDSDNKSIKSDKNVEHMSDISDKMTNATNGLTEKPISPIPLIKKLNRDGSKHITKNWLISDVPKKKPDNNSRQLNNLSQANFNASALAFSVDLKNNDQENANALNLIRADDLVNRKQVAGIPFRPKPVTELLKQIREINNSSPILMASSKNDQLKMELEDFKFKTGDFKLKIFKIIFFNMIFIYFCLKFLEKL